MAWRHWGGTCPCLGSSMHGVCTAALPSGGTATMHSSILLVQGWAHSSMQACSGVGNQELNRQPGAWCRPVLLAGASVSASRAQALPVCGNCNCCTSVWPLRCTLSEALVSAQLLDAGGDMTGQYGRPGVTAMTDVHMLL